MIILDKLQKLHELAKRGVSGEATIDVLWKHYESELECFEAAFIHKHGLGIKSNKEDENKNPLDIAKLLGYMGSVEQKTLHKQISKV